MTVTVAGTSGTDVTASPATLTFTTVNWGTAQTVTVTAAADSDHDHDTVTLTHSASGGGYGDTLFDDVSVRVKDNDIPGVTIAPTAMWIDEGDTAGGTYSVVLDSVPTGSVTVEVNGTSGTDVTASPMTLTFTTMNWETAQTVTVTAGEDTDQALDVVTLTHDASGGGYGSVSIASVDVRVRDDDIGVRASPRQIGLDEGESATYELRAEGGPWDRMTVSVAPSGSAVTVNPPTVTFTQSDWNRPKTIRVTAGQDTNWSNESAAIDHGVAGYGAISTDSVEVTVNDDDRVQAHIDSAGIVSLTEGRSRTYHIWLYSAPSEPVTVTVAAPSKLSVNRTSLRFNSTNWSRRQAVRLEALHDSDTSDEKRYVTHTVTDGGGNSRQLDSVQVEVTDDDDGEDQIGPRPSGAVWWAALTARSEVDGLTGHINYTGPVNTGKLSNIHFTQGGALREIQGLFVNSIGNLQLWVDSGNAAALPNSLVLHVGTESLALGSATRQSFKTTYTDGRAPTMRDHTYWWFSGSHSVSLSDREVVAVWLEAPSGSELPGAPMSAEAQARDGGAGLEWVAPPEVPSKPVTSYEYQQEGTEEWTSTNGAATTEEVTGLANGASYRFRVRAVNAAGKGAASAPTAPVTPGAPGLTAAFVSVPPAHDGSTAFTLRLEFSEDVAGRFRKMRNDIFEVTGGAVTDLRRVNRRRDLWTVTVAPSSHDAVTVSVPTGRACDVSGAVCTADGERLSSRVEATVPGPLPAVSVSAGIEPGDGRHGGRVHPHARRRHGGRVDGVGERERGRRGCCRDSAGGGGLCGGLGER